MTAPRPSARKPLTSAHVGEHLFEVWRTPYGDFQILHYVGRYLIPLHRTEPTEPASARTVRARCGTVHRE